MDTKVLTDQITALQSQIDTLRDLIKDEEGPPKEPGRFVKFDRMKQLVYAEVYLPDIEDAHGHQMTAVEIEKMAHGFMKHARTTQIDLNHDNDTDYGCYMVESFIAREGDPDYTPGAWVGVVKVENPDVWQQILSGEITGFSFEGMGYVREEEAA